MGEPKDVVAAFEAALDEASAPVYVFRLFVAGTTTQSQTAITRLKQMCEARFKGHYLLEVIDVYQQPALAKAEQVIAVPTLVKRRPLPERRVIGDLSSEERVLGGLELPARKREQPGPKHHAKKTGSKRRPTR